MGNKESKLIREILIITSVFIVLLLFMNPTNFQIADEGCFWKNIEAYKLGLVNFKTNDLPMTPFYLIFFGGLHKNWGLDIISLRVVNLVLFTIILFLLFDSAKREIDFYKLLLIIAITPYFLFLSISIYTDMLFMFFILLAFVLYDHEKYLLSCLMFAFAISTRQFGVVFPATLTLLNLNAQDKRKWMYPLISCFAIMFWFLAFGFSLSPAGSGQANIGIDITSGFLFLATFGAFYKVPELLLFKRKGKDIQAILKEILAVLIIGLAFSVLLLLYKNYGNFLYLNPHHWFNFLYLSPLKFIFIGILSAFSLVFARNKFERLLLIMSFAMFCFINVYFDKYAVPYVLVLGYNLLKNRRGAT